jgi:hypothetical protein
MTYVEYMRRLGVSVEPEVKAEVEPVVETVGTSFRYQGELDGYVSRIPSRTTDSLLVSRRALPLSLFVDSTEVDYSEYSRRVLLAIDLELAHRNGIPL